jgi:hypothetical protein
MSAAGAMMSDIATEFAATAYSSTAAFDAARVNAALDRLGAVPRLRRPRRASRHRRIYRRGAL